MEERSWRGRVAQCCRVKEPTSLFPAGLNDTAAEFEHKAKFPYKKAQVLQKLPQLSQLQPPATPPVPCPPLPSQLTPIMNTNSSAWQIWPSPSLSLVGGGAGCCSFKATGLGMTMGCMAVVRDNNWSQHNWEWTGSGSRTGVHVSEFTTLLPRLWWDHAQQDVLRAWITAYAKSLTIINK